MRVLRRSAKGFSLIEVLVAVLIVGVGILGVAGMQVVSLQQNRNVLLRDQALQAANDVLDRMRANDNVEYFPVALTDAPSSDANCILNTCNRDEMAEFDVAQWKCGINPLDDDGDLHDICVTFGILQASLPGGRGAIALVNDVEEVTVDWLSDREGNRTSVTIRSQTEALE